MSHLSEKYVTFLISINRAKNVNNKQLFVITLSSNELYCMNIVHRRVHICTTRKNYLVFPRVNHVNKLDTMVIPIRIAEIELVYT